MTNKETAIALLSEFKEKHTFYGKDHERDMNDTFDLAIKALKFQYKMTFGNCDYCKFKGNDPTEYPCCVCGNDEERGYFEMWEETDNETD